MGGINCFVLCQVVVIVFCFVEVVLCLMIVLFVWWELLFEFDFVYFFKVVGWMLGGLFGVIVFYVLVWLMYDSMVISVVLVEVKQQCGMFVCQFGYMSYGDGLLYDMVFVEFYFVCDDWKMLQVIQEEEICVGLLVMKVM